MALGVFVGLPGTGKTFCMTVVGGAFALAARCPIYANYPVSVPGVASVYLGDPVDFLSLDGPAVLLWDEADLFVDSRRFSSGLNIDFGRLAKFTRHKSFVLLIASQTFGRVDKRVRDLSSWVCLCNVRRGADRLPDYFRLLFCSLNFQGDQEEFVPLASYRLAARPFLDLGLYDPYGWKSWLPDQKK